MIYQKVQPRKQRRNWDMVAPTWTADCPFLGHMLAYVEPNKGMICISDTAQITVPTISLGNGWDVLSLWLEFPGFAPALFWQNSHVLSFCWHSGSLLVLYIYGHQLSICPINIISITFISDSITLCIEWFLGFELHEY